MSSSIEMSFKSLCDTIPSVSSIEYVRYYREDQQVWCTWEEFEQVAKTVKGKLKGRYSIRVVGDDWWVDYYGCDDSYYSAWRRHRIWEQPETHVKPKDDDL